MTKILIKTQNSPFRGLGGILLLLFISFSLHAEKIKIQTGIEVLKAENFKSLAGKRVGLITNPTGVDNNLKSTIDILFEAPNVKLVALYAPEHGVRGDVYAGDKVTDTIDVKTGIPVYSLYSRKASKYSEVLKNIDVLVYDIQDIGSRSYTYISTMGKAMQASAEAGVEFMVLDRPNPLGGNRVEGNLAEDGFISGVSQFKIPYLYGLTCGELALMLNAEPQLGNTKACKLQVVKMKGWKRKMFYSETGLQNQWVPTSPHIPEASSAFYYQSSGIVGEFSYMSIGVGYTVPFKLFAAPWINGVELSNKLNGLKLPGVIFRPIYLQPFYGAYKGQNIQGVQFHITDFEKVPLTEIQFYVVQEAVALYPDHKLFTDEFRNRFNMFDKVCGSDKIRELFGKNYRWEDAKAYWDKDVDAWKKLSKKYWLYR